jgi:ribosome maturation protein Sdo1
MREFQNYIKPTIRTNAALSFNIARLNSGCVKIEVVAEINSGLGNREGSTNIDQIIKQKPLTTTKIFTDKKQGKKAKNVFVYFGNSL